MNDPGPIIETYTIAADGKSITCKRCKRTSYHPRDIEERYCGSCHVFHEDLWPPIREAWINGSVPLERQP